MSIVLVSITQQPTGALIALRRSSAIRSSEDRAVFIEAAIIRHNSRVSTTMATIVSFDFGSEGHWVIKTSTSDIGQQAIRQLTFVASNQRCVKCL